MVKIIIDVVALGAVLVVGFVVGVLFGRRNTQKVNTAVADANKVITAVESKLGKK